MQRGQPSRDPLALVERAGVVGDLLIASLAVGDRVLGAFDRRVGHGDCRHRRLTSLVPASARRPVRGGSIGDGDAVDASRIEESGPMAACLGLEHSRLAAAALGRLGSVAVAPGFLACRTTGHGLRRRRPPRPARRPGTNTIHLAAALAGSIVLEPSPPVRTSHDRLASRSGARSSPEESLEQMAEVRQRAAAFLVRTRACPAGPRAIAAPNSTVRSRSSASAAHHGSRLRPDRSAGSSRCAVLQVYHAIRKPLTDRLRFFQNLAGIPSELI